MEYPSPAQIDERILSFARERWRKAAFVLGGVGHQLGDEGIEVSYDALAERLHHLIEDGRLDAAGDISNWRRSEVRLGTVRRAD